MDNLPNFDIPEEYREHLSSIRQQQLQLAKQLDLSSKLNLSNIHLVAGLDVAFHESDTLACAGISVVGFQTYEIIEEQIEFFKPPIPYIPSFLHTRESTGYHAVTKKLEIKPDLFMFDGNGIIHPYGLGLASQMGLELNEPTIGIAKELLLGEYEPPLQKGGYSKIVHQGQIIGVAFQTTNPPAKPIFASQGHKIDLNSVINILRGFTQHQVFQTKLPLPIFLADKLVKEKIGN
ncbi:MAG: endonuclease V [Candidatus Heimdallarchaeota archaeon]|nr:endonuclease V [Candidatus Heimdallarchaeota archaeon]